MVLALSRVSSNDPICPAYCVAAGAGFPNLPHIVLMDEGERAHEMRLHRVDQNFKRGEFGFGNDACVADNLLPGGLVPDWYIDAEIPDDRYALGSRTQ